MSILEVIEWPKKVLETKADPVVDFNEEIKKMVSDMFETMDDAGGIGLAANQVDVLKRVIVIHIPFNQKKYEEGDESEKRHWHDKKYVFINPEIISKSGKISYQEGCLSFPEIFDFVDRAAEVKVKAYDENGKQFEVDADGLFSICIQHEIDHIDGIVFINRMSRLKKMRIKRQIAHRQTVEMKEKEVEA